MFTTISITKELKEKIDKLKTYRSDTYQTVLTRLIDELEKLRTENKALRDDVAFLKRNYEAVNKVMDVFLPGKLDILDRAIGEAWQREQEEIKEQEEEEKATISSQLEFMEKHQIEKLGQIGFTPSERKEHMRQIRKQEEKLKKQLKNVKKGDAEDFEALSSSPSEEEKK